jgi:hypothetical protein
MNGSGVVASPGLDGPYVELSRCRWGPVLHVAPTRRERGGMVCRVVVGQPGNPKSKGKAWRLDI